MKLDRDVNKDGVGKYAVVNMRKVREIEGRCGALSSAPYLREDVRNALDLLEQVGVLDYGRGEKDFFLIRLADRFAYRALHAYAMAVYADAVQADEASKENRKSLLEYSEAVLALAQKAEHWANKKTPDALPLETER